MALLAGANFINHACGWLEGGLCTGFEKSVIDADMCGKLIAFAQGIDMSDNAQAMDAIFEVGPGAHFLSSTHTMKNYKTAFYRSPIADSNSFEQWQTEGSLNLAAIANRRYKQLLESYQQPYIDPSVREELESYVARRKASMPDRSY